MTCTAKTRSSLTFILAAAILGGSVFFSQAGAKGHTTQSHPMESALDFLMKAQRASDETAKSALLNSALQQLQKSLQKSVSHDQKAQAATLIQSALSDLENHDSGKVKEDITQAIAEVREGLAIYHGGSVQTADDSSSSPSVPEETAPTTSASDTAPAPSVPKPPAPTVKLTEDQTRAVVLIKGDNAEGTEFLIKTADGPVVVTNIHVIANNPNLNITTNTGVPVTILSYKGAADRDLVMIAIKDGDFKYLELATDVSGTVQPGDDVVTPGNSEGGEVMLNTAGKVLGIGPGRVEFDNPIYHGNSGGPVIHVKSGKVIGVVTEAVKVDVSDDLDKTSFESRNSAISGSMRYFGLRLDTVQKWEPYDWNNFQLQTTFLDQFNLRSRCLDSYLNPPAGTKTTSHKKKGSKKDDGDNNQDATQATDLYLSDKQIMQANDTFVKDTEITDTSNRIQSLRQLVANLQAVADTNMEAIQNMSNFYSFYQLRARDEIAYRKALKTELSSCNDNIDRLSHLAR